jgi:hypothetical protein
MATLKRSWIRHDGGGGTGRGYAWQCVFVAYRRINQAPWVVIYTVGGRIICTRVLT